MNTVKLVRDVIHWDNVISCFVFTSHDKIIQREKNNKYSSENKIYYACENVSFQYSQLFL